MTISDPALEWFQTIVEPTVAEFLAAPGDKRRGCLAALTIDAMLEHFYQARSEVRAQYSRVQEFRDSIWNKRLNGPPGPDRNFTISLLHDVANASKHVSRKDATPAKAGRMGYEDIESCEVNVFGVMRCGWPMSSEPQVIVGKNGEWLLSEIIDCAMDFWREKLEIRGDD